ncbi:MAG: radical SAM protein [Moorellaceae bacterium]
MTELIHLPLKELLTAAWRTRETNFPPELVVALPGTKHFDNGLYRNNPYVFPAVSLTGTKCELQCLHCRGKMLEGMHRVSSPEELVELGKRLADEGCVGLLVSGGSDTKGRVPLAAFWDALSRLKALGLAVVVHTGLVDAETAANLKSCGIDRVLVDIIGDDETARRVCGVAQGAAPYWRTLDVLLEAGLKVTPHVILGLYFSRLKGELEAVGGILNRGLKDVVFVVLKPLPGTPMEAVAPPEPASAVKIVAAARITAPEANLRLGCARPGGRYAERIETYALAAGVNAVAYPSALLIRLAEKKGLRIVCRYTCCCLV